jgi:hypothetical protein
MYAGRLILVLHVGVELSHIEPPEFRFNHHVCPAAHVIPDSIFVEFATTL